MPGSLIFRAGVGEAIRYAHKYDDGSVGKVAFTDTGKRVEVNDWKNREATLAAMQLANEKQGELNVKGPEKHKEIVLQLAAEHGYQAANPELKERFEAEKARVEAERQKTAGFEGRGGEKEKPPADASTRPFEAYPGMQAERGPAPIPNEKVAEYAEAYRAVTAHKTAEVENFVNVLRDMRYAAVMNSADQIAASYLNSAGADPERPLMARAQRALQFAARLGWPRRADNAEADRDRWHRQAQRGVFSRILAGAKPEL